ncbi:hypothetical protein [Streptococcus australis]|uniref:hypothetical protein n=1 Tax=Streptococcus australis TaxID=113107 RepID=UPI000F9F91EB|nr:hypothetical protein [Streptococcus australis]RSJ95719.1 hypothetical protein D8785_07235 [Streptococcus australis]
MMREYKFDVHNEMFVSIPEEREKVCLALSDSLKVINEELTPSYKAKLDNLLDQSSVWYPTALEKDSGGISRTSARQTPFHFYLV